MSEQLLTVLRLCLLGLVYLFFLRVLRAVWVEVHGPRRLRARRPEPAPVAASPGVPAAATPTRIGHIPQAVPGHHGVALRVLEPDVLAGQQFPIGDEATIGRAPGCSVTLDDTYVSQVHARLLASASGYVLEDLHSTNGTYVNRAKVTAPTVVQPGDRIQIGNIVMELA